MLAAAAKPSPLEYALAATKAGLCVVPPREDGSKQPLVEWKELQETQPDAVQLKNWYRTGRSGVGFICGSTSGNLELFDFDDRSAYERFRNLAIGRSLGDLVERIEAGYLEETPNNGVHWLYRCSEIAGNTKLARRPKTPDEMKGPGDKVKVLIETRGEGGYVVTAPSNGRVHPSGKAYRLLRGGVDQIATITPDERLALWSLARTLDRMPIEQFREPVPASSAKGTRPGDSFNERAAWTDILEPHGWTRVAQHGDETFWKRPGSENKWSATTNYRGSDLLYVFTTSTTFNSERAYSKFAAYTLLEHGGDFSAAAQALSAKGYGEQAPRLEIPAGGLHAERETPPNGPAAVEPADAADAADAAYPIQTISEMLAAEEVELGQIVEGLLWEGQITWLFSAVNAGKTLIMVAWGLHIAAGRPFCGRTVKQGPVLFIEEDSSLAKLREYVEKLADLFEIETDGLPMYFNKTQGFRLTNETELATAKNVVNGCAVKPLVVMFDACESIVPSERYTSKELDYLRQFLLWLVDQQIAALMADHCKQPQMFKGKEVQPSDPMNLLFGGLVKKRVADLAIHLSGTLKKGGVTLNFVKARSAVPDPVELTYADDVGFGIVGRVKKANTETERKLLQWLNHNRPAEWHEQLEIISGPGISERTGRRALAAMFGRGLLERDASTGREATRYRVNQTQLGSVFES